MNNGNTGLVFILASIDQHEECLHRKSRCNKQKDAEMEQETYLRFPDKFVYRLSSTMHCIYYEMNHLHRDVLWSTKFWLCCK